MSEDEMCRASRRLLGRIAQFGSIDQLDHYWNDVLVEVLEATGAAGVSLEAHSPSRMSLRAGGAGQTLALAASAWFEEGLPHPARRVEVRHDEAGSAVYLSLGRDPSLFTGYIVAFFTGGREFPLDSMLALQSTLEIVAVLGQRTVALRETESRLSRLQHLYEVGEAISSTLDLNQVLRQSTERVSQVLGAEACTLMLLDDTTKELVFEIPAGPATQILREHRMPMDKGVAGWVAEHGEAIIIPEVAADERFYGSVDLFSGFHTRSLMAVPLQVKGRIIGVVEVVNKTGSGTFTREDQQCLCILAPLIAAAIDNARLFAALRLERDRIITAEENVRHQLARDLHDGPAQVLSAMLLNIDMARRQLASKPETVASELEFLDGLAREGNREVRDLLFGLRPLALETHGLIAALRQLVERVRGEAELLLNVGDLRDSALDPKVASTLFVIIQEALSNASRHARARQVQIRLGTSKSEVVAEVEDDGIGFDVKQVDATYGQRNSFGLLNMRERARLIDGRTEILSPPRTGSQGTLVRVTVPGSLARSVA